MFIACLQAVTGCFYRGKPGPFANRAPSWIFNTRGPGDERASAKNEGGGGGEKRKTACWKTRASSGQNLNPVHQQTGFLIGQETIARL